MIVDRNGENLLRVVLTDHEIIQGLFDFRWFHQTNRRLAVDRGLLHLSVNDRLAHVYARVADVNARTGDYFFYFRLRFTAEGAQRHTRRFCHKLK